MKLSPYYFIFFFSCIFPFVLSSSNTSYVIRASFQVPGVSDNAYFFADTRYVRIKYKEGVIDDSIVYGPSTTIDVWPSLRKARIAVVDAVLPIPNGEAYFFSGIQYARIKVAPGTWSDYIITGPNSIVDYWPSLKKAGFKTVDAVLPIPNSEAYFFSGTQYARIKFTPGKTNDYIIYGPANIAGSWSSLKKAGFKTIDSVLPISNKRAYFFSGTQYARIEFTPGVFNDTIINGPSSVAEYWPSLKKAGFY